MQYSRTTKQRPFAALRAGCLAVSALTLVFVHPVLSMWATPQIVPVARLAANMKAYVDEHPDDPQGWYVLGRVHGLAYVLRSRVIAEWTRRSRESDLPAIADDSFQGWVAYWNEDHPGQLPTVEERIDHLQKAVRATAKAIELDPAPAHYHLSLASILEEGAILAGQVDVVPDMPDADEVAPGDAENVAALLEEIANGDRAERERATRKLRDMLPAVAPLLHDRREDESEHVRATVRDLLADHWRDVAAIYYYKAHVRAAGEDLKIEQQPLRGLKVLVSYEAGTAFVRIVTARGPRDEAERGWLAEVEENVQKLENKPQSGMITPIVFGLGDRLSLPDLLAEDRTVQFDLDGDGRAERWPWVRPDTALLVWDPDCTGRITSGRQLFGSVTWWMFFTDGYHALDALDNDRDGELAGDELRGVRAWFDRDANGRSDPGEVVDLAAIGVEAIAARAVTTTGGCPANPFGLRMTDGRTLPTYDWVTAPAPDDSSEAPVPAAAP